MNLARLATVGLVATSILPAAYADNLGAWEDENSVMSFEIYVSYDNGNDNDPSLGFLPSAPLSTITTALGIAQPLLALGNQVTINLEPGTPVSGASSGEYDPDHGEVFPLVIPAFGLALEGLSPGVIIDGRGLSSGISNLLVSVPTLGNESLPPSVVRGITFQGASTAMSIAPAVSTGNLLSPTIEVQVRDCEFLGNPIGIQVFNPLNRFSENVIERNLFTGDVRLASAIQESGLGRASNLYRANDISNFEFAITVSNGGATADNRVRLMNNFVQLAVICVQLQNCDPLVANNTIAYAVNYGGDLTVKGIEWTGTTINLFNNIIHCPLAGSGAMVADDLDLSPIGQANSFNNAVEDLNAPQPDFTTGNLHPGLLNPVDLHLSGTSAMIGFGSLALITGTPASPLPLTYGSPSAITNTTRADVNMDIDSDPRVLRGPAPGSPFQVDAGADEVSGTRLSLTAAANQDALGNVFSDGQGNYQIQFDTSGAPGQAYGILYSLAFVDTEVAGGIVIRNGAVYSNTLLPGAGNFLLEDNLALNAPATPVLQSFSPSGDGNFTFNLNAIPAGFVEAELYFQMFSADAQGALTLSNRVGVELNF